MIFILGLWLILTANVMQNYMRENQVIRHNAFITVMLVNFLAGIGMTVIGILQFAEFIWGR